MEVLKAPWIELEVTGYLRLLNESRTEALRSGNQEAKTRTTKMLTPQTSIGPGGELAVRQVRQKFLQIVKWISDVPRVPAQGRDITGYSITAELSDGYNTIKCEFSLECLTTLELNEKQSTEKPIGHLIRPSSFELVLQGSCGKLFWDNVSFADQCAGMASSAPMSGQGMGRQQRLSSDKHSLPRDWKSIPPPEPIFRIHKLKLITRDNKIHYSSNHLTNTLIPLKSIDVLNRRLGSLPRQPFSNSEAKPAEGNAGKRKLAPTDEEQDIQLRSQPPSPHEAQPRKKPKLRMASFDESSSQIEFATQAPVSFSSSVASSFARTQDSPRNTHKAEEKGDINSSNSHRATVGSGTRHGYGRLNYNPEARSDSSETEFNARAAGSRHPDIKNLKASSYSGLIQATPHTQDEGNATPRLRRPAEPKDIVNSFIRLYPEWDEITKIPDEDIKIPNDQRKSLELESGNSFFRPLHQR